MNWHIDPTSAARTAALPTLRGGIDRGPRDHVRRVPGLFGGRRRRRRVGRGVVDVDDTLDAPLSGGRAFAARARMFRGRPDRRRHGPRAGSYLLAVPSACCWRSRAAIGRFDAAFGIFLLFAPLGPLIATAAAFGVGRTRARGAPDRSHVDVADRAHPTVAGVVRRSCSPPAVPWLADADGWRWRGCCRRWRWRSVARAVDVDRGRACRASSWSLWVAMPLVLRSGADLMDAFAGPVQIAVVVAAAAGAVVIIARHPRSTTGRLDDRTRRDPTRWSSGTDAAGCAASTSGRHRGRRAARPERGGQDHAAENARHRAGTHLGLAPGSRARSGQPTDGSRSAARSGTSRKRSGSTRTSPCSNSSTTSRS